MQTNVKTLRESRKTQHQRLQTLHMKDIDVFAGRIGHDLNNLLACIQGNVSLMLYAIDSDHPFFEGLKDIEEYLQRGESLMEELLNISRGRRKETVSTDLNLLTRNSTEMFARTRKEIIVQQKYQENIWSVDVDPDQMEQVLLNLYINAVHAMSGQGRLCVETENITLAEGHGELSDGKPGRYVRMSVRDTGIGMSKQTLEKMFDPFFTTREKDNGRGLGLTSVHNIIERHSGIINVKSREGEGTTFSIYLPAIVSHSETQARRSRSYGNKKPRSRRADRPAGFREQGHAKRGDNSMQTGDISLGTCANSNSDSRLYRSDDREDPACT